MGETAREANQLGSPPLIGFLRVLDRRAKIEIINPFWIFGLRNFKTFEAFLTRNLIFGGHGRLGLSSCHFQVKNKLDVATSKCLIFIITSKFKVSRVKKLVAVHFSILKP